MLAQDLANASEPAKVTWGKTLEDAAFVKEGIAHIRYPQYEYECLGLGGTMMRVGPDGFTQPGASAVNTNGFLKHMPYLSYQYWWDE